MSSPSGALSNYQFSCNGLYDPNISGTGHQPLYFDQMTALYNHYTVIGSKINIRVVPTAASEDLFYAGAYINDDATAIYSDHSAITENSLGVGKVVPASSQDVTSFSRKWSAKKMFGGSVLNNTLMKGTSVANPTEQSYYNLVVQAIGTASVTATVFVDITYIAVWTELKEVAQS